MKANKTLLALMLFSSFSSADTLIKEINLIGEVNNLSKESKDLIYDELKGLHGKTVSLETIEQITSKLTEGLNNSNEEKYVIDFHKSLFDKGNLVLSIKKSSYISYKGTENFTTENLKNSLPSLSLDKFYEDGRQWFDQRELNMAQDNPLKYTLLHYDLNPETKTSVLTIYPHAPYGKDYAYVNVDNYGSKSINYTRINVGYINANLTGNDDVFTIIGSTNFKKPENYYAIGMNYNYPFYKYHQTLGAYLGYSHTNTDERSGLANGLDRKIAKGNMLTAGLNWSYYLPQFDIGLKDQFKLNAGYLVRLYDQDSSIEANQNQLKYDDNKKYSLAGVNIGISAEIKLTQNSEIKFNLSQAYYSHKIPGSSRTYNLTNSGYDRSYYLTNYGLSYSQDFANWNFKTEINGQYTKNKIPNIDYQSITGVYNVRGFRYDFISADKGVVWRNELTTPSYTSFKIKNYAFYDWGKFNYNDSNRKDSSVSSAGLGIKAEIVKGLTADFYVARRLHHANYDHLDNGKISDKTSFWGKISYGF